MVDVVGSGSRVRIVGVYLRRSGRGDCRWRDRRLLGRYARALAPSGDTADKWVRPSRIDHIGIQTNDLDNAVRWYRAFLGLEPSWSLDRFSPLTVSRLPGIRRLVEIKGAGVRLHLFERPGLPAVNPAESVTQFQHLCMAVDSAEDLSVLRTKWLALYASGRFQFALQELPTDVVVDDDGVQSFYAYDVHGLGPLAAGCLPPDVERLIGPTVRSASRCQGPRTVTAPPRLFDSQ